MWQSLQIYHVNVNCTDLERSLSFYKMLGFEEVYDIPACDMPGLGLEPGRGRAKLLRLGSDPRASLLDLIEWKNPPTTGVPYPHLAHAGIARLCLRVKNLDEMVEYLTAQGIEFLSAPVMPGLAGGKQKFVCFHDPDGSVLELMEFYR